MTMMTTKTIEMDAMTPERVILGCGEHRYECIHDWLTPPPGQMFGDTHGLAQDAAGNIYVAHTSRPEALRQDAICFFDERGRFVRSFGAAFAGGAHGLDLRREGEQEYLYLSDVRRCRVTKMTLDGVTVWETGLPEEARFLYRMPDGEKDLPFVPTNVAFSPYGDFYITDGYGSDYVHRFTRDGVYVQSFGGKGKEPGRLLNAHGMAVDNRGAEPVLVVADRGNNRLQYFTLGGQHIGFITEGMRQPCHIDFRGEWMLVPDLRSVLTILDGQHRVVAQLGDGYPTNLRNAPRAEFLPGQFIHPHDALFMKTGDILVAEWVPIGRITLLRRVI
jgi:hypothetical protein